MVVLFSYLFALVYLPDTFVQNNLFIYLQCIYLFICPFARPCPSIQNNVYLFVVCMVGCLVIYLHLFI